MYFGMFHMCDVRDCTSSAKSVIIITTDFADDHQLLMIVVM